MKKPSKLFRKTLLVLILLFGVITVSMSAYSGWNLRTHLTDEFISKGDAIARGVAESGVELLLYRDASTIQTVVDEYLEIDGVAYILVVNTKGEILSHTFSPDVPSELLTIIHHSATSNTTQVNKITLAGSRHFIDLASPILNGAVGMVHVGMDEDLINRHILLATLSQQLIIALIFLGTLLVAYFLVIRISRPLTALTEYSTLLASHDFSSSLLAEEAIKKLAFGGRDEVSELASSFIYLEKKLMEYIQDLKETTSQKERIESELNIARSIQMNILPKVFPRFGQREQVSLFAKVEPAKQVGGDLYDFFLLDDDHLGIIIGDVSGKGVPAALFMAVTKTLIKAIATSGIKGPAEVLKKVNRELCVDNEDMMFVTAFYGILSLKDNVLTYSLAGHNPPYYLRARDKAIMPFESTQGMALAVSEDQEFSSVRMQLSPGDGVFLYTDGVTEALSADKVFFTEERIEGFLRTLSAESSEAMVTAVVEEIQRFSEGVLADDVTAMAIMIDPA